MLRFIETALHFVAYFLGLLSGLSPNLRGCCDYPRVALGIVSLESARRPARLPCAHFSGDGTPYPPRQKSQQAGSPFAGQAGGPNSLTYWSSSKMELIRNLCHRRKNKTAGPC